MPRLGVPLATDTDTRLPPDVRDGSGPLPRSITPLQKRSTGTQFPPSFQSPLTLKKGRKEGTFMATELTEGAKAPAFKLPRDGGGTISLADFKGRKLVIYAYPRADTPG